VAVPALWWNTARIDLADPTIALCIKDSKVAVIFLAIIASKDVEFLVE